MNYRYKKKIYESKTHILARAGLKSWIIALCVAIYSHFPLVADDIFGGIYKFAIIFYCY